MPTTRFGSRNMRFLALKGVTRAFPSLKQRYPFYDRILPLTEAGESQELCEQQDLVLTPEERAYARRFDPPLPDIVNRSIVLVKLAGATVVGRTGTVIDEQRGVLLHSRYTADRYGLRATYHDFTDSPSHLVDKPEANYFSMVGEYRGHRHFFHFLFDRLPRIHYLLARFGGENRPFVVLTNETLPGFQQDIYRFLANRHSNLTFMPVPQGERWRLPTLYLIDDMQPVRRTYLAADTMHFLRKLVMTGYGLKAARPCRRLYINRSDTRKRNVRNEAEIWPSFARRGFESIAAGNLSFHDQVRLFSEAEMVAGPHGAGFSNLLFAPAGAKVLEISNIERVKSVYFLLSKARGQHYHPLVGGPGDRNEAFRVDPQAVEAALAALETTT